MFEEHIGHQPSLASKLRPPHFLLNWRDFSFAAFFIGYPDRFRWALRLLSMRYLVGRKDVHRCQSLCFASRAPARPWQENVPRRAGHNYLFPPIGSFEPWFSGIFCGYAGFLSIAKRR